VQAAFRRKKHPSGTWLPAQNSPRIAREIAAARREHFELHAALCRIRDLADNFTAPAWACTSNRALLSELRLLEGNTLRHVLVEDHVLFPRLAA
jgi:regulator of cell morphogenesis and NO signaling